MELLNIKKYASYFHDGLIYDLNVIDKNVIITMRSAQLDEYENDDHIELGKFNMIRGKLHLINVSKFNIDDKPCELYDLIHNLADIHDLEFNNNLILLNISWIFELKGNIFQTIEFLTEKYFFENLPHLVLPGDEKFDDEGRYIGPRT